MSARRIISRRQWMSDCPPVFDRAAKERRAYVLGLPKPDDRTTYREWRSQGSPTFAYYPTKEQAK